MLRLTKSVSDENYPISPQTSAVRKLKVRAQPQSVCDLSNSYLIIKNSLTTTVNGANVVRNVGWGASMSQKNQWEYPASCQIRTAALYIGGQLVEYNEDLNVRRVNMDVYAKSAERIRKEANMGSYGFQRLPGPKIATPNATTANMHSGNYLSPFLDIDENNNVEYKQVSSIIHLSDIFEFCRVATDANLAGKEVVVELQFEDRNTLLTEFVNYKTQLDGVTNPPTVNSVLPFDHQVMKVDNTIQFVTGAGNTAFDPTTWPDPDTEVRIQMMNKYYSLNECPLFVGQPICLWNTTPVTANTTGSNIFTISSLSLAAAVGGAATPVAPGNTAAKVASPLIVGVVAYKARGQYVTPLTAGNQALQSQIVANIAVTDATVGNQTAKFLSCVNDPVIVAGAVTLYTNNDAGLTTTYSVDGLELVMMEMPGVDGKKQTFEYFQYMRDVDVIPTGQLTYQKTFQLDPGCVAVYALFPCAKDVGAANTNMLSISHRSNVSEGLSWRNLLNGQSLYNRDIVFSALTDAVEPLYVHRLGLAAKQINLTMENLVQNQTWMSHDGTTCHAMVAEPVEFSQQPQQLAVRLNFNVNANSRTIYVYKAVLREFTV